VRLARFVPLDDADGEARLGVVRDVERVVDVTDAAGTTDTVALLEVGGTEVLHRLRAVRNAARARRAARPAGSPGPAGSEEQK
jgi:hypothetical protein